jgi:hypothetical protein
MVFLQNNEELVCSHLFFLRKLVWIESTTLWTGHGAVHCGPMVAITHGLTALAAKTTLWLAVRSSGARGRCEECIPKVFGEWAVLGRGGQWHLREKQRRRGLSGASGRRGCETLEVWWRSWEGGGITGARKVELGCLPMVVVASEITPFLLRV